MLVKGAGEGIRVGETLVQRAFKEGFGIKEASLGKERVGRINIEVEGLVERVDVDIEAIEVMPWAVVDALLDGRHGTNAFDFLMRIGSAEYFAVDDDGLEVGEALLEHPIYLKYALAIALGQFLPLVKVFTFRHHGGTFCELDLLPVAEETAVGSVDFFLDHETRFDRSVIADLFHEGAVEGVLDGTIFFECQHSVTFLAKVWRFRAPNKSLQGLQESGCEEDECNIK